jgi:hypothetical protein
MISKNMPELQEAFDLWIKKGSHELPTIQQCIDNGEVDMATLHHLAKFIWMQAGGYVSSEALQEMFHEAGVRINQTPESALAFLERAGLLTKIDDE